MKVTLKDNKVKCNGNVIGYYCMDAITKRWFADFANGGLTYIREALSLNDLRFNVRKALA